MGGSHVLSALTGAMAAQDNGCMLVEGASSEEEVQDGAAKAPVTSIRRCSLWALERTLALAAVLSCLYAFLPGNVAKEHARISSMVSLHGDADWTFDDTTGCTNWFTSAIGPSSQVSDMNACGNKCRGQTGCKAFSFQKTNDCSKGGGRGRGECFLWRDSCFPDGNNCWDYYKLSSWTPLPYTLTAKKTACANAQQVAMTDVTLEFNMNACLLKCESEPGCVAYNYQDGDCMSDTNAFKSGACILYSEECETTELHGCMDFFAKVQ